MFRRNGLLQILSLVQAEARMAQNEIGFTICRAADGTLAAGPVREGTPTGVSFPISCPPKHRIEGLFHTHPGGSTALSSVDIQTALRTGARNMCVEVPETGEMKCYKVARRRR